MKQQRKEISTPVLALLVLGVLLIVLGALQFDELQEFGEGLWDVLANDSGLHGACYIILIFTFVEALAEVASSNLGKTFTSLTALVSQAMILTYPAVLLMPGEFDHDLWSTLIVYVYVALVVVTKLLSMWATHKASVAAVRRNQFTQPVLEARGTQEKPTSD